MIKAITGNKVAFDSNLLIDFILNPFVKQFVFNYAILQNNPIYTSDVCKGEAIKKLEEYGEDDPSGKVNDMLKRLRIKILPTLQEDFKLGKSFEEKYKKIGAHAPDVFILANFIRNGVTHLFSVDNGILKVSNAIGIKPIKIPNKDTIGDMLVKKLFKR